MPHPSVDSLPANAERFESIDLLLPDVNGMCRGKRLNQALARKAFADGVLLPRSVYVSNVRGDTVDATGYGIASGDQDYLCRPDADTLRPIPWAPGNGQCMMEMYDAEGQALEISPRDRLRKIVAELRKLDWNPTVAVELEFYLFSNGLDEQRMPRLLIDPTTGIEDRSTQICSMDDLDNYRPFIDTVKEFCAVQSVPASTAVAEYAPGQFEINLSHKADPVAACDEAIWLKRIIRQAARQHDVNATFMAKPMADLAGSGMHIHASLYDSAGGNVMLDESKLRHAVGGLQETMSDAMLLWAPHANSYRRYARNWYVPLNPSWGYNNRSVALRVPAGPDQARRIEHRVAGADANPYLVMGAVLAGVLHGLTNAIEPDQPVEGDATKKFAPTLPTDWHRSILEFEQSPWIEAHFGAVFQGLLATIKRDEYAIFQSNVSPLDIQWYLQTV